MPIVDVEIVGPRTDAAGGTLAQRIADDVAAALNSRPNGTWVKVRFLDAGAYAENGPGRVDGDAPVFVHVLLRELPERDVLSQQASRLAAAVGQVCGRTSERVHVVFEPAGSGRVAFGGRLQE